MTWGQYLLQMAFGYFVTAMVESLLLVGTLSRRHPLKHRLFAGAWLSACTYPVVWLVLPAYIDVQAERTLYLVVAETFAPAAECWLFWLALGHAEPFTRRALLRDLAAIIAANLASFAVGEMVTAYDWWPILG